MSFTIYQIEEAQSKVKSGADFPAYAHALADMGVRSYETFVNDGHTVYTGGGDFRLQSDSKYPDLEISSKGEPDQFRHALSIHQQGQTDYPTFCSQVAEAGVDKWRVDLSQMTCTYYNKSGEKILMEKIPAP